MNKVPIKHIQGQDIPILCLGTVQLGLEYGVANKHGKPSNDLAHEIISKALERGIYHLDTATAYGNSEEIIGNYIEFNCPETLFLTSKLLPGDYEESNIQTDLENRVRISLQNLNQEKVNYFLLHDWDDYSRFNGQIWQALVDLKEKELFGFIGGSIYSPNQGLQALDDQTVSFLQIPFNILDHRWHKSGFKKRVEEIKKQNLDQVFIQARSIFLQGILTRKIEKFPLIDGFDAFNLYTKLDFLTEKFSRKNWMDLAFSYVRSQEWIDNIVIGVETVEQLEENYKLCFEEKLNGDEIGEIERVFSEMPKSLLNPAEWKF